MNRRHFLQLPLAAGARALLPGQSKPATAPVVVVGAGLAGLRAATILGQAGRQTIVLEARARVGGRVLTIRSPFDDGLYGEAGAIRIAGVHRAVLRAVRDHGLKLVPFESSNGAPLDSAGFAGAGRPGAAAAGGLRADERGLDARALLERYVGTLPSSLADPAATAASYAAWRDYDRSSWPEWLLQRGASPEAVRRMTMGGDSSGLSALYMLRQFAMLRSSSQLFKIAGGMDRLPQAMAAALGDVIRYEAAVVRVTRTPGSIAIEYESGGRHERLTGSHVVLAVPLPALRQIEFRPPLSSAKQKAASAAYYPGVRILLQSRERFWNRAGHNGSARTSRAEIWDAAYDRQNLARGVLGATAGGAIGTEFAKLTQPDSLAFGVDLVAEAFPGIRSALEKGVVHQWAQDRWAGGAFVAFAPGQMTALMPDIARPEDRLHFAGEHTSSWNSWMEGALESGERAAREILGSQGSTPRDRPWSQFF